MVKIRGCLSQRPNFVPSLGHEISDSGTKIRCDRIHLERKGTPPSLVRGKKNSAGLDVFKMYFFKEKNVEKTIFHTSRHCVIPSVSSIFDAPLSPKSIGEGGRIHDPSRRVP